MTVENLLPTAIESASFSLGAGETMTLIGAARPSGGIWRVSIARQMTDESWEFLGALTWERKMLMLVNEGTYQLTRVLGDCLVDGDRASSGGGGGGPGPAGPPGSPYITQTAATDLSAFQVVYGTPEGGVLPASPTDDATIDLIFGVTLSAASAGQSVQVQRSGLVTDPSLAIYPAGTRLYLGAGGTLTTIAPSAGYDVFIGAALGAGRVFLDVQPPIFLE